MYRIVLNNLAKQCSNLTLNKTSSNTCKTILKSSTSTSPLFKPFLHSLESWRLSHAFVSRLTAAQLWKGVTSVSPAGRRKGRAKATKKMKDLNRGQVIGFGKKNMVWPGLNAPVIQGKEIVRQHLLPPDEEREKRILEIRDRNISRRTNYVHPLDRGWAGKSLPGQSLGPPDPYGEDTFEGFDSRVLEFKPVLHMTGQRGRVRTLSALVVVGNKNGLAGYALSKSATGSTAAKAAKNKAARNLRHIERDDNTVVHDFCGEFGAIKVFVEKRPPGFGLICHRAIKAICELLGIKDIYAKVEGRTGNVQCVTRAFFIGLMKQKSLQQIAEEKGLHIVEMRKDQNYLPIVKASPQHVRTEQDIGPTELLDFVDHLHGGKVVQERKKYEPFYFKLDSYKKEMKDRAYLRNHRRVQIELICRYGKVTSFLQLQEEEKAKKNVKDTIESEELNS